MVQYNNALFWDVQLSFSVCEVPMKYVKVMTARGMMGHKGLGW